MDQIFLENVALLSKKCTSAQNAILDSACDELVKAFTRDEAKLSKGMKICLTHTKGLGYLADEKNQVVDWNALSFAEKLPLLKIMLTDFPADRWQELRYFTRSIGTPDALMALLGGFSDPEIIQNIVTHFANELVHDAEDAAKLLIAIKAKAPQIDWQKIPVFARVIDSTETLAQFIAHCGEHVPLKELVKFGAQHNEYLLLSSAQAARLLLSLPPEKKSIVPELFHAMESRLVRSTAASNVRAQFVFDVLKACVYGKNGSYIKSDTDMQTANSLLECLYNFLGSVQELLTLALSDEISDKVTKLLRELIFIVESPKGWDVKWRELSAFFMKHYLQFAASKKEDDIFFANGFREVLDKSFNLFHHGDVAVPVSVLSMHDEKLDYKKAVDETRAVLQRIVPAAAKKIHDIMHVKCDMQKFQQLLDLVVHHWLDEKGKRGKTISFFLKDRAAEARKKMHSLNELLTKYHVYVPKSLKKCNAVVHDVARAFVRRM